MRAIIVIPARYGSTRLPAKPLLAQTGKYLVQHVYERACRARRASDVLVATDDERIVQAVQSFGGRVVLTASDHATGTDRVAEVARRYPADIVVNLQGDEPQTDPEALDYVIELLEEHPAADMATLAAPLRSREKSLDRHTVKVVLADDGRALYFSRAPIPCVRDGEPEWESESLHFLQHLGLYAYRRPALLRLAASPPSYLEALEKLEQLRALSLGMRIQVGIVAQAGMAIDTWEDYHAFVAWWNQQRQAA